jgi:hypothetical protein
MIFSFFKDIFKFIAIFAIVLASFVFGLNNLYWYYNKEVREKSEVDITHGALHAEHGGHGGHGESSHEHEEIKAEEAFGS